MSTAKIPHRRLGKDGPEVTALGLGLMVMAGVYGTAPEAEAQLEFLDRALELGQTFWDTADMYTGSEELIGRWFERTGKRDQIFLASKFGIIMDGPELKGIDSSAEYCQRACEASLRKLRTDYIDLFYCHRANPDTPIEETMRALVELQKQGKIRHIGLCEISASALRRACKIAPVAAVQAEYSPIARDVEGEKSKHLLAACKELGVGLVAYSPLSRGLLTGTITATSASGPDDVRLKWMPRFAEGNIAANLRLVREFGALATDKKCSPTQLALAWLLKQGESVIPIPGTKRVKYLEENLGALDISLTDAEEAKIRSFLEKTDVQGERTTSGGLAFAYVDTREES